MRSTSWRAACSSASVEWATPDEIYVPLAAEFGPFDLDPAATAATARAPLFYTPADDGLAQHWPAARVWLNPPYGRTIGRWTAKAADEAASGRAGLVCCLVPARTDTRWWRELAAAAVLVRFLPGRVRFGGGDAAPFASAVVVLGRLRGRHGSEPAFCAECGAAFWPARHAVTCSPACRQRRSRIGRAKSARQ